MKRFDWYFFRIAATNMLVAAGGIALLYVAIDFIYNIDRFLNRSWIQAIEYYAYTVPPVLYTLAPLIVLLGGMFGVARLIKHRELLPLMAAGVRAARCLLAFWLLAGITVCAMFAAREYLLPGLEDRALAIQAGVKFAGGNDITLYDAAGNHWYIGAADARSQPARIENVAITTLDEYGRAKAQIMAPALEWRDGAWRGETRTFNASEFGALAGRRPERLVADDIISGNWLTPQSVATRQISSVARSITGQIERMRAEPWRADYRYSVYDALLYPLTCLTLLAIGAVVALRVQARNMIVAAALTVTLAFSTYCLAFFAQGLAQTGTVGPEFAAFGPFGLFAVLAVYALRWRAD